MKASSPPKRRPHHGKSYCLLPTKKQVKQHMSSDGIVRFGNAFLVLFVKLFLSRASILLHSICLDLFLHRYNLERAILLD